MEQIDPLKISMYLKFEKAELQIYGVYVYVTSYKQRNLPTMCLNDLLMMAIFDAKINQKLSDDSIV